MARRHSLIAALACLTSTLAAPEARAGLAFQFSPDAGTSQLAIDGFTAAGALWSNLLGDDITVNLEIGFRNLGSGVLGQAETMEARYNYSNVRNALIADARSADDAIATANLQAGAGVAMLINRTSNNPNGSGSATPYLDDDGDANNTTILMTNANAKAIGLLAANATGFDASIVFNSNFLFDFDRSDGISGGAFDFIGIAAHEIGHALGFISGVDTLDANSPPENGPFQDDQFAHVSTLDLFRYSQESRANGPGVIDWTADSRSKYFSIDGGATSTGATFSTGGQFGDGFQASHWEDDLGIGIMDPTAAPGELLQIRANDTRAFDVIGYNLAVAVVPEPSSMAMTGSALLVLAALARRRARASSAAA